MSEDRTKRRIELRIPRLRMTKRARTGKARVHEIAKELGLSSKEVIEKLEALGVEVRSHSSMIEEAQADRLRELVDGSVPASEAEGAPVEAVAPQAESGADGESTANGEPGSGAVVTVSRGVTVGEFAQAMGAPAPDIIKRLMMLGELKTITQSLSDDEVELLAHELDCDIRIVAPEEEPEPPAKVIAPEDGEAALLAPRPPVVTVMGHVDHGKSSILQQLRKKEMLSLEAGGITQAIGAYRVHGPDARAATFIDTPGHEAFTRMRARGAQVTDIAILVVAADDGVQPQTVEALDHARAARVPVVVAVNKIDKPEADTVRVRQQLAELGLNPEEWGGDTVFVDISAKEGTNLETLLEMIHLVADLQELRANPQGSARGFVIESHLDRGRGPVATLIVNKGNIKVGQPVVSGSAWCRVRAMLDETGQPTPEAGPSQPIQVSGWSKLPSAGDEFHVVDDEREAKRIAHDREVRQRQAELVATARPVALEDLLSKTRTGELPVLNLILKADTQGGLEALVDSLETLRQRPEGAQVRLNLLRKGVGAIGEGDVVLARASDGIVVGFNVRPDSGARQLAERERVDIRTYQVIYQLLDDIEQALRGLLKPVTKEVLTGSAQVRATFKVPRAVVAGCYVTEGKLTRGSRARLIRGGIVVYTGRIGTLRRFKEDAREVAAGFECGATLEDFNDVKEGDVVEAFEMREVPAR
ncbi:MAG: translation initiation factor IF-2 [Actinomycetota bacterium]